MSKVWNVAVVGCNIGRSHIAEGYANLPGSFRVLALCDLDEARMTAVGDEFGVPRRTTRFDDLLAMDDLDIIDICTPPALHIPQSKAALAAGKQVVCEKPVAASLAEIDALIAAEADAIGNVMPIFQYRWGKGFQKALDVVRSGLAGRPLVATIETHWNRDAAYYAVPWRGRFETELGGVLATHALHLHDMMAMMMGPIASLSAFLATRVNDIEVEDCLAASLLMESGALVTLSATLGSATDSSRLRFCFENVSFESGREPYQPGSEPWTVDVRTPELEPDVQDVLARSPDVHTRFHGQMADYAASLANGSPPPVTLADARRALELITALYHAHDTGGQVQLPLLADHPKYRDWRPLRPRRGS
jgi:predicted dehydrogenase